MSVKEIICELFCPDKDDEIRVLNIEAYEASRKISSLQKEIDRLNEVIKGYESNYRYYIGVDENGMESKRIEADRISFYDDKYVFYLNGVIVGILSSDIYKEVVLVSEEKENQR